MTSAFWALLLAAAPTVRAPNAVLHAPSSGAAVGRVAEVELTLGAWRSPTRVAFTHQNAAFTVSAELDLADEGTFVEVRSAVPTALSDTGGWSVLVTPEATLALVGHDGTRWRVGFPEARGGPSRLGTLAPSPVTAKVPAAGAPVDCLATPLHAAARADAATWAPSRLEWTLTRSGPVARGWARIRAVASGVVVLGYVEAAALSCEVEPPGGLGLRGSGGAGDGVILAQEATLPAGTALFASPEDAAPIATLRQPTRALKTEDGLWRVPEVRHGQRVLSLHSVRVRSEAGLSLGAPRQVGVGSAFSARPAWPRLEPAAESPEPGSPGSE